MHVVNLKKNKNWSSIYFSCPN